MTFLDHLQRNPRLQPYEFWPLMANLTVLVQHVCSIIIFVCCFVAIFQERICPKVIVSMGSVATIAGWILWDIWVADIVQKAGRKNTECESEGEDELSSSSASSASAAVLKKSSDFSSSMFGPTSPLTTSTTFTPNHLADGARRCRQSSEIDVDVHSNNPYGDETIGVSARNQKRIVTVKSAILIYCAVLGLSPILKSLTQSTSSDSIWAMSCWLIFVNVFFFHYDASPISRHTFRESHTLITDCTDVRMTASLSTNAALMASTLLASRLPSTTHVFSLTLFSIEIFALFPIFRRLLSYVSWRGHFILTTMLVIGAGGGLNMVIIGPGAGWKAAIIGMILGSIIIGIAMGLCSWWLIGLQKYKNEIYGPWDPARPVIRVRLD